MGTSPQHKNGAVMHIRYVIVCLGILIIAQLVFFNYNQKKTIKTLETKNRQFDAHINSLENQKQTGQKKLDNLVEVFNMVRPWLETGIKDPEKGFMKFLDFLEPGLLKTVAAKVNLPGTPTFNAKPIPLQRTGYQISFNFTDPAKVESFLKKLLLQHDYPLMVNSLEVHTEGKQDAKESQVSGTLNIDLLLPANRAQLNLEELKKMGVL